MKTHVVKIDRSKSLAQEPGTGHNRWHEDIPPVLKVQPGDQVVMETRDALDGQITSASNADDVSRADLRPAHALTGPVYIEGAEPGDLLEVKIQAVQPEAFGFTVQVPGFSFLRDLFPEPHIVRWDIKDGFAQSRDLPGVRVPGAPFMGVMGVAPSRKLRESIQAREAALAARGGIALPPEPGGAVPAAGDIAQHGLRTIPPREIAGNLDIKQLVAGTTLLIPVATHGALFSVGDAHFAQGDGETCGTAIEMSATFTAQLALRKGAAKQRNLHSVQYFKDGAGPGARRGMDRFYATTGLCIRGDGQNESEDVTLAARNAYLAMIDYLVHERGFNRQQAYAICSVAVDLAISEVVDVPNVVVSAFLPLDIFV
ncbi:MAG: acetamidase/formamidase family protein [Deltaproteobacteria bacterium]|nr:MAG: acetamidase/formamidase family protein [Deltaproteobacteria bacterium]